MKSLDDVKEDMSSVFDDYRAGAVKREDAEAFSNIAGKIIKIYALQFAERAFDAQFGVRVDTQAVIAGAKKKSLAKPSETTS